MLTPYLEVVTYRSADALVSETVETDAPERGWGFGRDVTNLDFERASGFANAALAFLKRSQIPPFPVYFELFYTYATGANPELNKRINAILIDAGVITLHDASLLCEEFLKISDMDKRLRQMSEIMNRKITDVNQAIEVAMETAHSYSGSLKQASGDLETGGIDEEALKLLSSRLLKETRRMQDMNRKLEAELENTRDDITVLQRDLDEVRKESMLDPLTKLANRKAFDDQLEEAIKTARTSGKPLSLLVFDIDHFKAFNDTYGHLTGDQVLRLVAQVLKANIRNRDLPARFGGEEFMVILPETDLSGGMNVGETIRAAVRSKELLKRSTNEKLGRITLSVGVATLRSDDTAASLIERADRCLYAAKRNGRNRLAAEHQLSEDDGTIDVA